MQSLGEGGGEGMFLLELRYMSVIHVHCPYGPTFQDQLRMQEMVFKKFIKRF